MGDKRPVSAGPRYSYINRRALQGDTTAAKVMKATRPVSAGPTAPPKPSQCAPWMEFDTATPQSVSSQNLGRSYLGHNSQRPATAGMHGHRRNQNAVSHMQVSRRPRSALASGGLFQGGVEGLGTNPCCFLSCSPTYESEVVKIQHRFDKMGISCVFGPRTTAHQLLNAACTCTTFFAFIDRQYCMDPICMDQFRRAKNASRKLYVLILNRLCLDDHETQWLQHLDDDPGLIDFHDQFHNNWQHLADWIQREVRTTCAKQLHRQRQVYNAVLAAQPEKASTTKRRTTTLRESDEGVHEDEMHKRPGPNKRSSKRHSDKNMHEGDHMHTVPSTREKEKAIEEMYFASPSMESREPLFFAETSESGILQAPSGGFPDESESTLAAESCSFAWDHPDKRRKPAKIPVVRVGRLKTVGDPSQLIGWNLLCRTEF